MIKFFTSPSPSNDHYIFKTDNGQWFVVRKLGEEIEPLTWWNDSDTQRFINNGQMKEISHQDLMNMLR